MARPSKYKPEYVEQAKKLCEHGFTLFELARFFEVGERTVKRWMATHPEFGEAVRIGRVPADARVEMSLYQRATGYSVVEEKLFCHEGQVVRAKTLKHYPPDTTAMIFWLKNRKPAEWRDRIDFAVSEDEQATVSSEPMSPDEWERQYSH